MSQYDGCNVMAAEVWVTMSKRISAVSGSNITEVSQRLGDTLQINTNIFVCRWDLSFWRYAVSGAEVAKKWSKI